MGMNYKTSISVVVPVYNEAEVIEKTIQSFIMKLSDLTNDFEIVLINDASTDETADILRRLASLNKNLKVFNNSKNIGSGASLWRGLQLSSKELVMSNFADSPFDLADLRDTLPLFKNNGTDFIIIVRKDRSANSPFRKITSFANYLLIKILFNSRIHDFQFVQIFRGEILKGLQIISTGTFVPPEIMLRLIFKNYKFREVRCIFHKRLDGKSKCGNLVEILRTVKEIFYFRILTLLGFAI